MFFKSYDKIAERLEEYQLSEQAFWALQKIDWVVCEKIHGANFCVICTEAGLTYAKRKELLEEEDDFFGYRQAMAGKETGLHALFAQVRQDLPAVQTVLVYGELFGGAYPHPEVAPLSDAVAVQTGVYYAPHIEFCIFDIGISTDGKTQTYLPYPAVQRSCSAVGLLHSQPLWVGKLSEALQYDIDFDSTLPALLGLPALPANRAEGVVIKPLQSNTVETPKGTLRPILKRKIEEFSETHYQQSTGKQGGADLLAIKQLAMGMLTQNRLNNALSKVGRVGKKDTQKRAQLVALIEADIQESITQQFVQVWQKTPQKQRQAFWSETRQTIEDLVERFV